MKNFILLILVSIVFTGTANATLIGDTVSGSEGGDFFSEISSPTALVTTGGPEFSVDYSLGRAILVDIGANSIDFTWNNIANAFFGSGGMFITISDLDWIGEFGSILGVSITQTGVTGNIVTFTQDSITLNLQDSWRDNNNVHVDLITSHNNVPEPTSLALLSLGLAGFGFTRRRKTS